MCLTAPGRVVDIEPDACLIDTAGRVARVSTLLAGIDDLSIGDWVLVSGGTVVRRLAADQADAMQASFEIAFMPNPRSFATETDR